jgi:anti-sigma factor RsiW
MSAPTLCPELPTLQALLDGVLPPRRDRRLVEHLETCLACRTALQGLAASEWSWAELPRLLAPQPPVGPALREAIARLTARLTGRTPGESGKGA